jgi:hypothetical protein
MFAEAFDIAKKPGNEAKAEAASSVARDAGFAQAERGLAIARGTF